MGNVVNLDAVRTGEREDASAQDGRFSPSFLDLGKLQLLAASLLPVNPEPNAHFPEPYRKAVSTMLHRYVRGIRTVLFDVETRTVTFDTEDKFGSFAYSFSLAEYLPPLNRRA